MDTYKVVRHYFRGGRRVIKKNLTLEEAKNHCRDAETSSDTCKKPWNKKRTRLIGKWFDGYYRQ